MECILIVPTTVVMDILNYLPLHGIIATSKSCKRFTMIFKLYKKTLPYGMFLINFTTKFLSAKLTKPISDDYYEEHGDSIDIEEAALDFPEPGSPQIGYYDLDFRNTNIKNMVARLNEIMDDLVSLSSQQKMLLLITATSYYTKKMPPDLIEYTTSGMSEEVKNCIGSIETMSVSNVLNTLGEIKLDEKSDHKAIHTEIAAIHDLLLVQLRGYPYKVHKLVCLIRQGKKNFRLQNIPYRRPA